MDLFKDKNLSPMLIAEMQEPFDDPDWIYELKLDGCRCVAYLEENRVVLRNKRNMELLPRFPELKDIYKQAKKRCVLDGELLVMVKGVPDFYELQKRTLLTDRFKIELGAECLPASFVAYDCLQYGDKILFYSPILERKRLLEDVIMENERIAVSRYIPENGTALFAMTVQQELEGVVAKRKDSLYFPGKRSKDWVKFKRMADKDFVICGYEIGEMTSLILGEYQSGELSYAATVTLGVRREVVRNLEKSSCPFQEVPKGHDKAVWCVPEQVCTVEYMPNTKDALRQPVFKGIREDVVLKN